MAEGDQLWEQCPICHDFIHYIKGQHIPYRVFQDHLHELHTDALKAHLWKEVIDEEIARVNKTVQKDAD
jgi:hypothetical protein